MSTPELLKDLLVTILSIQKELKGSDFEKVKAAQEAYHELLDGFYEEYQDMIAPQQYEAAKDDPDYFIALIQLAYYYQNQGEVDSEGEQSLSYFNWKLFTQI
jgi:Tfp pilus assembly protein PilF